MDEREMTDLIYLVTTACGVLQQQLMSARSLQLFQLFL